MIETQESIVVWADETFGEAKSLFRILTRANEEMAELLVAVELEPHKAPEEAADTAIVLLRAAHRIGLPLEIPQIGKPLQITIELVPAAFAARTLAQAIAFTACAVRANEEGRESFQRHVGDRIISTILALHHVCELLGSSLQFEIDNKMQINRKRTWKRDGSGHAYHCGE